jgi:Bromodomain
VQERLDAGNVYITLEIFRADLARIWANARHYNGEETIFAKAANALERLAEQHFLSTLHEHRIA